MRKSVKFYIHNECTWPPFCKLCQIVYQLGFANKKTFVMSLDVLDVLSATKTRSKGLQSPISQLKYYLSFSRLREQSAAKGGGL